MRDLGKMICDEIDWSHPDLCAVPAKTHFEAGEYDAAVEAFVLGLRSRAEARTGYTREYVMHLRAACPEEEVQSAIDQVEGQMEMDMRLPYHSNPFAALGAETLFLIRNPALFERMAERVMDHRPNWEKGFQFGGTGAIGEVLRCLLMIEECPDRAIVPWLGWLILRMRDEWSRSVRWNEATLGTSNHNWIACAFSGFYTAGILLPEFKSLGKFRALGATYLEQVVHELFEEDGWIKEGSPGYHEFAANVVFAMAHLAERNGELLSDSVRRRLRTIADTNWKVVLPDGRYPLFGDYVHVGRYRGFTGQNRADRWAVAVLRRHAARYSLGRSKFVAAKISPDWTPLYGGILPDHGQDVLAAYQALPEVHPETVDTALPQSGLYVMRQNWTAHADCMALVAGATGPRVTSHKHADLLSFELYSRGRRILVDNGYGLPGEERDDDRGRMWRVGTSAHNTVTVDGKDNVEILQEFSYNQTVVPLVDKWVSDRSYAYFSGVHEGYTNRGIGVAAVRRKVFYLRDRYWILIDRLTSSGAAEHTYQLHFHLNVPGEPDAGGRVITSGQGGNLLIAPVPGFSGEATIEDNPYPIENYENPRHLTYTRKAVGHDLFVTVMIPFSDAEVPEVSTRVMEVECDDRKLSPWEGTGLEIEVNGEKDFYFDQHMTWTLPWSCGPYSGNQRLFHSQLA